MEGSILELVGIVPQLALALLVAWIIIKRDETWRAYFKESAQEYGKRDDAWRTCFKEATTEYRELVERLERVIITSTEAISRLAVQEEFRKELAKDIVAELNKRKEE